MGVPDFEPTGLLPQGRHVCSLDDFERAFVLDAAFSGSVRRGPIFGDLLSALSHLEQGFSADLVERLWVGGGFTTNKLDPGDIDVTFLLNQEEHEQLSRTKRDNLEKILRVDGFKSIGLSVDGFMMVRNRVANPWRAGGVASAAAPYLQKRGAWDDWWSRIRRHGSPEQAPLVEDADPIRGYVEVIF